MKDRVNSSMYLKIPDGLELRLGISLFHTHGHWDTCLARYLPSFIEGGWQIDGKTIETLWAPLNEISRSTRGMSMSHFREVIDDHMNNLNWKKLIDLGKLPLTCTASKLIEIMQSMLYLNTTAGRFLGKCSAWQHLVTSMDRQVQILPGFGLKRRNTQERSIYKMLLPWMSMISGWKGVSLITLPYFLLITGFSPFLGRNPS